MSTSLNAFALLAPLTFVFGCESALPQTISLDGVDNVGSAAESKADRATCAAACRALYYGCRMRLTSGGRELSYSECSDDCEQNWPRGRAECVTANSCGQVPGCFSTDAAPGPDAGSVAADAGSGATGESDAFRQAADELELTDESRAVAWEVHQAFSQYRTRVTVAQGEQPVSYDCPFVGPGAITPEVLVLLSRLHGRNEIGYYRVENNRCRDNTCFILQLFGRIGGTDPRDAVELIMHNHPGGTRSLSRGAGSTDCGFICRNQQQTHTILTYGWNRSLGNRNAACDLKSVRLSCGC